MRPSPGSIRDILSKLYKRYYTILLDLHEKIENLQQYKFRAQCIVSDSNPLIPSIQWVMIQLSLNIFSEGIQSSNGLTVNCEI